jgi:Flp pilus assembly protein TadG
MASEKLLRHKVSTAARRLQRFTRPQAQIDSGSPARAGRIKACLCGEEGAELVEFAASAIILCGFFLGVMGLSLVFFMYNTAAEAARETTRWASVRGTDCSNPNINDGSCPSVGGGATTAQVQAYGRSLPGASGMTVTVQWCNNSGSSCGTTNRGAGSTVKVTESFTFASIPFVSRGNLTVSSTSQSVIW